MSGAGPAPAEAAELAPAGPLADSLRGLVIGLLVAVPLVFDPRAGHPGGRPKYLVLVLGSAVGAVLLAATALRGRRPWPAGGLGWAVLAFVSWNAVSTALSAHPDTAVFGFAGSYDGLLTCLALAVVFLATVDGFRASHVRGALETLWYGTATAVLVFGVAQLADRLVSPEGGWDWARPSIAPHTIGSTLGNPNHLAGFLAILLPVGVVLAVLSRGRRRLASVTVGALVLVELAITTSRGGLLGAGAAVAALAVLFWRELGAFRRPALAAAGGVAALGLLVTVGLGALGVTKLDIGSLAETGSGSTVDLRREVWAAGLRVAADHPLAGVGPDVFAEVFPGYASDRFLLLFGPFTVANGAHNLFLNVLANLGPVGLLAFLTVLALACVRIPRTWRRLTEAGSPELEKRLLLGGVAAALIAYLVQGSFNTQSVALSLLFWLLLGLAVVLCD